MTSPYILSPLNYIGGKGRLLPSLLPLLPKGIDTFVDLFCGGCNVGINVPARRHIYNDALPDLVGLLATMRRIEGKDIAAALREIIAAYGFTDTRLHGYAAYGTDSSTGVAAANREPFARLRDHFNNLGDKDDHYYIALYALVVFGFNNQLRFNAQGRYNLPVGKRDFNASLERKLLRFAARLRCQEAEFRCGDFRDFDLSRLNAGSFVYVDPPYLITTATYNENGGWQAGDEAALLRFLTRLDKRGIRFALSNVLSHKGRTNDILRHWLTATGMHCQHLQMDYASSNYHTRGQSSRSDEVVITNYQPAITRQQHDLFQAPAAVV